MAKAMGVRAVVIGRAALDGGGGGDCEDLVLAALRELVTNSCGLAALVHLMSCDSNPFGCADGR
eukprot:1937507-Pleurochrysis_carterae.AAC.3